MFEIKEDTNGKKFALIPSEDSTQPKLKKEKFICGSKCCRQNWVNKLIKAKMTGLPSQRALQSEEDEEPECELYFDASGQGAMQDTIEKEKVHELVLELQQALKEGASMADFEVMLQQLNTLTKV